MKKNLLHLLSVFTLVSLGLFFWGSQASAIQIGDIVIRFCDDQGALDKQVSFEMDPLETRSVCLKVFNTSEEEASVQLAFVDGTVTKDESQYKACLTANDTKNFGKFARMQDTLVKVPAKDAVETSFTLEYPSGYAGMSYGCVVSKVITDAVDAQDGMMSVELRQGHFIDVFVNGDILLDVLFDIVDTEAFPSSFIDIDHTRFSSVAKTSARLVNSGNIAQEVVVVPSISGMFGFSFEGKEQTVVLNPGESRVFSDELELPWYGFGIDVKYSASTTPVFDFESSVITEEMKETKHLSESISVFLVPYWLLVCLGFIFVVLVVSSYRKRKSIPMIGRTVSTSRPKKNKKTIAKKKSSSKSSQARITKKSAVKQTTISTKTVKSSKTPATKTVKRDSTTAKKVNETKKTVKKPVKKLVKKNSKK